MKAALPDANVLLALAWPNHQHHAQAHMWFAEHAEKGWATCAFTQLAFVQLSSNPAYTSHAVFPQDAAELLQQWTQLRSHRFWTSTPADRPAIYARALGHQQVNGAWLVDVARQNKGCIVTLDTRLPVHSTEAGLVELIAT